MHCARPAPPRTTRATVRCGSGLSLPATSLAPGPLKALVVESTCRSAARQQHFYKKSPRLYRGLFFSYSSQRFGQPRTASSGMKRKAESDDQAAMGGRSQRQQDDRFSGEGAWWLAGLHAVGLEPGGRDVLPGSGPSMGGRISRAGRAEGEEAMTMHRSSCTATRRELAHGRFELFVF